MEDIANHLMTKINNKKYTVIFFGLSYCPYSLKTKEYLKLHNIKYKYYKIDKYYNNFFIILQKLSDINPNLNININHKTFPVIFYNKKFIGGYDNLLTLAK